jgi:DNA modification methylase
MKIELYNSECLEKLKELGDNSVDAIVTDPPYGLSFMGKKWDYDVPSIEIWQECLRVLKPGGHMLAFSSSRTYHRMAVRVEDAGFEIRDQLMWIYGSGFPKSHNISKAIDATINTGKSSPSYINKSEMSKTDGEVVQVLQPNNGILGNKKLVTKTINASLNADKAKEWKGWGTALKPAHEPIVMARKPLEGTVANNVLKWGTGGINIDACRIGTEIISTHNAPKGTFAGGEPERGSDTSSYTEHEGRFPANIILDEEAGVILDEQTGVSKSQKRSSKHNKKTEHTNTFTPPKSDYRNDNTYEDEGGASRFFYCPKVSSKERNAGCDDLEKKDKAGKDFRPNHKVKAELGEDGNPFGRWGKIANNHPTVKPIALMEYLIKLVSKEEATILDPFMGSGSTGIAAKKLNRAFVGIEMDEGYYTIASKRIGKDKKE